LGKREEERDRESEREAARVVGREGGRETKAVGDAYRGLTRKETSSSGRTATSMSMAEARRRSHC
jgi:hypothetical protein